MHIWSHCRPRKLRTSPTLVGAGAFWMTSTFLSSGDRPAAEILKPKKTSSETLKRHLSLFRMSLLRTPGIPFRTCVMTTFPGLMTNRKFIAYTALSLGEWRRLSVHESLGAAQSGGNLNVGLTWRKLSPHLPMLGWEASLARFESLKHHAKT